MMIITFVNYIFRLLEFLFSFKWPFGETVCTLYGSVGFLFAVNSITVISATAAMRHRKIFSVQRGKLSVWTGYRFHQGV